MTENEHITITLNENESVVENPPTQRGRSRTRRSRSRSRSPSRSRTRRDTDSARRDATPLLPEGALPRQKPPHSGPEIDEEENEGDNSGGVPGFGIDDGFFEVDGRSPPPKKPGVNGRETPTPPKRGSVPAIFPYSPGYVPGMIVPAVEPRIIPDINVYQHKKTLAQGMMDLALLSANANQLRYVLESRDRHPYYWFSVSFIVASLVFQVLVGVGLVLNSRYNVKDQDDICKADRINNLITIAILLITIINVFISAFGVAEIRN